ncbi:MAG: hypothetical protein ACTHLT_12590 [Devosia sp.]
MLLLAVGLTSRSYVSRHRRLQAYTLEDFDHIVSLIDGASGVATCPNVWSETSNLVRYASAPLSERIAATLRLLIERWDETYIESTAAAARAEHTRLGVTDAVLLVMAQSGSVLLTDDLPIYLAAKRAGYAAINFNHLRGALRQMKQGRPWRDAPR